MTEEAEEDSLRLDSHRSHTCMRKLQYPQPSHINFRVDNAMLLTLCSLPINQFEEPDPEVLPCGWLSDHT